MDWNLVFLGLAIFGVAALYSSVGHGGGSGYLMVLALASFPKEQVRATALVLNLFVAATAFYGFKGTGAFSWKLTWPLLLGSIPLAFVGGSLKVDDKVYYVLLGVALFVAGIRLLLPMRGNDDLQETCPPQIWLAVPIGAAIGVLSGIVGVGGGIFLSPLVLLLGWGNARHAAATSALFIFVNSAAGLLGGIQSKGMPELGGIWVWLPCAWLGGMLGAYIGSRKLPLPALRRLLGGVLVFASVKLGLKS